MTGLYSTVENHGNTPEHPGTLNIHRSCTVRKPTVYAEGSVKHSCEIGTTARKVRNETAADAV